MWQKCGKMIPIRFKEEQLHWLKIKNLKLSGLNVRKRVQLACSYTRVLELRPTVHNHAVYKQPRNGVTVKTDFLVNKNQFFQPHEKSIGNISEIFRVENLIWRLTSRTQVQFSKTPLSENPLYERGYMVRMVLSNLNGNFQT